MSASLKSSFQKDGYAVARGLFDAEETAALRGHYMRLRTEDRPEPRENHRDPLARYPRLMHMHRTDERSLAWLTDARLRDALTLLLGAEPFAVQTMLYFKPPGSRGQALHQDNFYLRAQPGTCVAAWMALDRSDESNGCLQVVPGSHTWPVLCTEQADTKVSFTDITVPLAGHEAVPVVMEPGDVLFFNGSLVHGSLPNTHSSAFRRALIGHYVEGAAEEVGRHYHPVLRMDGTPLELGVAEGGGPCGEWVEAEDGGHAISVQGVQTLTRKHE